MAAGLEQSSYLGYQDCVSRLVGVSKKTRHSGLLNLDTSAKPLSPDFAVTHGRHVPFPITGISTCDQTTPRRVVVAVLAVLRNLVLLPNNLESIALHAGIIKSTLALSRASDDTIACTAAEVLSVAASRIDLTGALRGFLWRYSRVLTTLSLSRAGELFSVQFSSRERVSHGGSNIARARLREASVRVYTSVVAALPRFMVGLLGSNDHRRIILGVEGLCNLCSVSSNRPLMSTHVSTAAYQRICDLLSVRVCVEGLGVCCSPSLSCCSRVQVCSPGLEDVTWQDTEREGVPAG